MKRLCWKCGGSGEEEQPGRELVPCFACGGIGNLPERSPQHEATIRRAWKLRAFERHTRKAMFDVARTSTELAMLQINLQLALEAAGLPVPTLEQARAEVERAMAERGSEGA